jgi:aminoglycoside/choline kinase family phosphotransferase
MFLVEDVGRVSLFEAARREPDKTADLYRDAITELLRIHVDGTARGDSRCVAFGVAYDRRVFRWEMNRFVEFGLPALDRPGYSPADISREIAEVARELERFPRVLSHRDYHGNNLFIQNGRIRVIDFQDALMAPHAQDLAVLMTTRDTSDLISPDVESRLLDFYYSCIGRRGAGVSPHHEFIRSYRLCVLQHALKCIGLFAWLTRDGKSGFKAYIPYAIAQARRMLVAIDGYSSLKAAFAQ